MELRHATAQCPKCQDKVELRRRVRLWEGASARAAAQAAALLRAGGPGQWQPQQRLVRHDSPVDAAAAAGREHRNASRRAEAVAETLGRLDGTFAYASLMQALEKAGLSADRAEKERIRLLAQDHIFEPTVGHYRML